MHITLPKMIDPTWVSPMSPAKARARMTEEEFLTQQKRYAEKRMTEVDRLPPAARLLVHEYGLRQVTRWLERGTLSEVLRAINMAKVSDLDLDI